MTSKLTSKFPIRAGLLQHSAAWFLGALVLMFVTAPFVEELPDGRIIEAALLTVVLGSAVLAVGGRRQTLIIASLLMTPVVGARWLHHFQLGDGSYTFHIAAYVIFMAFVVFQFLRFILRAPRISSEVLCAAVAIYLLLGMLWAAAYVFVGRMDPGAFSGVAAGNQPLHGFDALYFSVSTLTTMGYGDIAPVSGPARMLAVMEVITGTMYMAVLVARLVSGYSSTPHSPSGKDQ